MNQTLQFTVPLVPPSANHIYAPVMYTGRDGYPHRGRKITKEAIAYKEAVALFAKGERMVDAPAYSVTVTIHLGYKMRGDLANFEKVITDGIQDAGVFPNDSRVKHYTLIMGERDWANPRTEISIAVMGQPTATTKEKPSGKVSSPGMRERVQEQRGARESHSAGARVECGWRAVASGQYRKAQGENK